MKGVLRWMLLVLVAALAGLGNSPFHPIDFTIMNQRVSPARLPLVLYAVNGILPIMICAGRGLWWAVAFGSVAMLTPLVLAIRVRTPRGINSIAARSSAEIAAELR